MATVFQKLCIRQLHLISIHTTLAGGDKRTAAWKAPWKISIHTTLAGGDACLCERRDFDHDFNPHHPRGWRPTSVSPLMPHIHFNPHHPRGWRLVTTSPVPAVTYFNPHHPRGWRPTIHCTVHGPQRFQSTPPSRVATSTYPRLCKHFFISIHTTLAGGDSLQAGSTRLYMDFNPHHPRGWRLFSKYQFILQQNFNPHHPRGWRHRVVANDWVKYDFNPHHPRGWRPPFCGETSSDLLHFNPHHPRGWRPAAEEGWRYVDEFQSTPPSRVATASGKDGRLIQPFQSTPPSRVATGEIGNWNSVL